MTKLMCLPVSHNIFDVSSSVFSVPRAKTKLPIYPFNSVEFLSHQTFTVHCSISQRTVAFLSVLTQDPFHFAWTKSRKTFHFLMFKCNGLLLLDTIRPYIGICVPSAVQFILMCLLKVGGTFSFSTYLIQPNRQLLRRSQAKTNTQNAHQVLAKSLHFYEI